MDSSHPVYSVEVKHHGSHNYKVTVFFSNPNTSRKLKREFIIHIAAATKEKDAWNENVVTGAVLKYMKGQSRMGFMNSITRREKGLGVYRILKQLTKRKGSTFLLQQLEVEGKRYNAYDQKDSNRFILFGGEPVRRQQKSPCNRREEKKKCEEVSEVESKEPPVDIIEGGGEEGEESLQQTTLSKEGVNNISSNVGGEEDHKYDSPIIRASRQSIEQQAKPTPKASIFTPGDTGATFALVGKSKSGKTTFLVNQLNRMTEKEVEGYNAIVFFTTSLHASPLKDIAPHVKKRLIMVGRFVPKILQVMKRINDETDCRYRFLVIFDDILKLRGELLHECILTLRNSNISTVLSIQYVKLMAPAQRDSIHNFYLFNMKADPWEFMLRGFILGNIKEEVPPMRSVNRVGEASIIMRQIMNPFILYHDQVNDTTEFFIKKS